MAGNPTNTDLISESQWLVRFLAQQVKSRIPSWIELDDLIGYGQIGLVQAARDYDATRGVKFSTFAYYRIRGAIHDGVNKLMWFRTSRDSEAKYDQMVDDYLQETTNESPDNEKKASGELSREVGWLTQSVGALAMSYLASTDGADRSSDVVDKSTRPPWSEIVQQETHLKLTQAIDQLEPELAVLVRAVYYDNQTLQEAANRLKISKSWASRIHARALEQMARHLKHSNQGECTIDENLAC